MTTYRTAATERLVQDWTRLGRQFCLTFAYQPAGVIDVLTVVQPVHDPEAAGRPELLARARHVAADYSLQADYDDRGRSLAVRICPPAPPVLSPSASKGHGQSALRSLRRRLAWSKREDYLS